MIEPLAFCIEIRMINVHKNLASFNPLLRNWVSSINRVQYWAPVSLEGKQITIFLFARIKDDRLFEFYRFRVCTTNGRWNEWKIVTFATRTAVLLIVLWAICKRAGDSKIPHVEGEPPIVTFRAVTSNYAGRTYTTRKQPSHGQFKAHKIKPADASSSKSLGKLANT